MLEQHDGMLKFSDVFEAAGVSRGSAYRIYDGIDDLFQDIASEWIGGFVDYLRSNHTAFQPENWAELSDFIVGRGADYWAATTETLRLLRRVRANEPASYRADVQTMSQTLADIFDSFLVMPEVPDWQRKLAFVTEICDIAFTDALRTEGQISEQRVTETKALCRTYLAFHLPAELPVRRRAG